MADGSTNNDSIRDENRDVAAVVIAGVLVAVSLGLGVVEWFAQRRVEWTFKELGIGLPGITIFAIDYSIIHVIAIAVLAGSAAMIAIKGLRVIGFCAWVIFLFLYLGFWALSFGLPLIKMTDGGLGPEVSSP